MVMMVVGSRSAMDDATVSNRAPFQGVDQRAIKRGDGFMES